MSHSTDLTASSATLAALLKISRRHVARLADSGVFKRLSDSPRAGFDLRQAIPAYLTHTQAERSGDLAEARLRLTEAQRRDLELRTRQRAKRLVAIEDVSNCFEAAMTTVGGQLDGLAGRMCGELSALSDPAVIRQRLFDETRRIRNAAADQLDALADGAQGRESTPGATAEDG